MADSKISVSYVVNSSEYNKNINQMKSNMKLLNAEIQTSSQEVLTYGSSIQTLTKKQESISLAIEQSKKIIEEYEKQLTKNNATLEKNKNKLTELAKEKQDATNAYKEAIKIYGEESEEALKAKEALDEVTKSYEKQEKKVTSNQNAIKNNLTQIERTKQEQLKLEQQLEQTTEAIEDQGDKFAESAKKYAEAGKKLEEAGGKISDLGENVQKAGALIVTAGVALGKMALDAEQDLSTLSGRLGVTTEEAESLKQVAKNLYNDGFGDSLEECVNDLVLLQQNIKDTADMTDEQKGKLLEQISTVKTLFGVESEELTRTLNNMLQNGVIDNIQEGLDLITVGFQNGLNSSGDLLDVLYEYSPQFKKLGLDGESALEMIKAGLDAGGYNADKMADALKELSIRVIDGSNTTKEGFELIGKNADEMAKKFAAGGDTAKQALDETIEALKNMEDPIKQDLAGVNLFGTMWEDSSKQAILAMGDVGTGLGDITDATKKAGEEVNNSIGNQFTASIRKLKDSLIPLGEALLPVLDDVIDGIGDISNVISKLDPELIKSVAKFGAFSLAIGTCINVTGNLVTALGKGATGLSSLLTIFSKTTSIAEFTTALGSSEGAVGTLISGLSSLGLSATGIATTLGGVTLAVGAVAGGLYAWKEVNEAVNSTVVESKGEYTALQNVMASLTGTHLRNREELEELGLVYKDFNENISDEFQESVKDMTTDIHEFGLAMSEINLDGVFSQDEINDMTSRVDTALNSALSAIESKSSEMQSGLSGAFSVDGVIDENETALLEYWNNRSAKEKEEAQNLQNEINNIILTARNEGRTLTAEEEAKIRDYYAQIKQIELEALASNQYEIEYATQEFQNRISTMDAESAKELLGQRYEEYNEQQIATKANYDTLIAMAKENYDNLSQEEKVQADETIKRLEEARDEELRINKEKYDANLQYAYEHNENLKTEFNRFTGELVAEKDRAYYEEYEQMMSHYQDIESITESGYQRMYDTATGTWNDLYVSINEETGAIKGVYDLNTQNLITMTKDNQSTLKDEVALWNQTSAGILANSLIIGNAYIDTSGQISDASGTIIGKLGQVTDEAGEVKDAILDVNGNPISIGDNTSTVINNLKATQEKVKATDGMKAQIVVTDNGTTSKVQTAINNISGKTVIVGVQYDSNGKPSYNGSTMYASGTNYSKEGIANVNESGWELIDTPNNASAMSLGRAVRGEYTYLPSGTKVTSHLNSTQQMNREIATQVDNKMNSLIIKTIDRYLSDILKEMKSKKGNNSNQTINVQKVEFPNATNSNDIEKAIMNLPSVAKQRANVRN